MQTENRFFSDLSKLATGAVGTMTGLKRELETVIRHRVEGLLGEADFVRRAEFDAVKAMAEKARLENEALAARVAALETKLGDNP